MHPWAERQAMTTERQIEANRINASRSSGPKSASGKARSRANATKHGMAGESAIEVATDAEFHERRAKWAAEQRPVGEAGHWALDRVVAATFRIERCEHALDQVVAESRERATMAWEEDRQVEAATAFARLARDPVLASRQLRASLAGVGLLVEAWLGLVAALEVGDWSESEASSALDLLGAAADLRSGRTLIDDPEGGNPIPYRRELAFEEIERLESLRDESMAPLDRMDHRRAMAGDLAVLSKPARLVLRYERDAWRRYNQAMKEVRDSAAGASPGQVGDPRVAGAKVERANVATRTPVQTVGPPPAAPRPAPASSHAEERRALQAAVAPIREGVIEGLRAMGLHDEDAWLEELERRIEAGPVATERTRFGLEPAGLGS
jgi:hypothetical protein